MPARPARIMAALALAIAMVSLPPAFGQAEAENLSASFRKAARRVLPAVVTVRTTAPSPPGGGGSGVVIDAARGLVLTNDHVVAPELSPLFPPRRGALALPRLVVTLPDGRERIVKDVKRDPRSDLALLTIDPQGLRQADWGDSDALDIGDWVLAVGQPFGLSDTVTAGIVSGKARGLALAFYEDLIQTDAAINPGNSGGPLVNLKGEVVGINAAIKSRHGGYEGVGFAVPSARARRIADDLASLGHVRRSYLGIRVGKLAQDADEGPRSLGAVPITGVLDGGPAARAGLRPGDILERVGGKAVGGTGALQSAIEAAPAGEPLILSIRRDGQPSDIEVRPEPQPESPGPAPPAFPIEPLAREDHPAGPAEEPEARQPSRFPSVGLRLSEPTPALIGRHGLDPAVKGLIVTGVEPEGAADRAGIEIGMVITDAADRKLSTLAEFRAALARRAPDADLVLRILRNNKPGFRVLLGRPEARSTTEPAPAPPSEGVPAP